MFQSRDETRKIYLDVWGKLKQGEILQPMETIIADVIQLHPEYHGLLESTESAMQAEFSPEGGVSNPFLHMGMHIALREQAQADRPPGFAQLYKKIMRRKDQHQAEHAMMECLGQSLWLAQQQNTMPDEAAYLECLKKI